MSWRGVLRNDSKMLFIRKNYWLLISGQWFQGIFYANVGIVQTSRIGDSKHGGISGKSFTAEKVFVLVCLTPFCCQSSGHWFVSSLHVFFDQILLVYHLKSRFTNEAQFRKILVVYQPQDSWIFCQSEFDLFTAMFVKSRSSSQPSLDIVLQNLSNQEECRLTTLYQLDL